MEETHRIYNLRYERIKVDDEPMMFRHSFNELPDKVDLRDKMPAIYNQGSLGSCTGCAGCAAYEYLANKPPNPSILFLYYNARMLDGRIEYDAGSSLYQCVKALEKFGVCPTRKWPYDISKFKIKPPQECYDNAKRNVITEYAQVKQSLRDMKGCLASGYPILIGIFIYPSFEQRSVSKTGVVPLPGKDEKIIGGHAVAIVGYDDEKKVFICRNSWGIEHGDKGHLYLPYDYIADERLATDLWTIKKTSHNN